MLWTEAKSPQIARFMWPTWGPPVSCRPQVGPMLAPMNLSSSSNFIPNRIQQYNTVHMTNIANSRVIIDIVMCFCWWPPEKPWAYQAGSHCLAIRVLRLYCWGTDHKILLEHIPGTIFYIWLCKVSLRCEQLICCFKNSYITWISLILVQFGFMVHITGT